MEEEIRSAVADNSEIQEPANETQPPTELEQLIQDKLELQDRLLRLQAEFDNSRRRAERERLEFAEYAGMEIVRSLLSVIDDFERAIKAANEAGSENSELVKGIELIYNRLLDTLKKEGLEPVDSQAAKFDPNLHHAIQMVQTEEADDGTVLEEYQRGYNYKGKLLRAAMVKVSVRP